VTNTGEGVAVEKELWQRITELIYAWTGIRGNDELMPTGLHTIAARTKRLFSPHYTNTGMHGIVSSLVGLLVYLRTNTNEFAKLMPQFFRVGVLVFKGTIPPLFPVHGLSPQHVRPPQSPY